MRWLIVVLATAALAGGAAWAARGWQADADLLRLENAHSQKLNKELRAKREAESRARKAEQAERDAVQQIEVNAHANAKRTENILAENRRLARLAGGLRDPGAAAGCRDRAGTPAPPGAAADPAAQGRLSDEAAEFLLAFAADADRAADYANACHAWVIELNP